MSVGVCAYLWFPLKDDNTASLVPCGQELSCVVELNSGDDISWGERHGDKDGGGKERGRYVVRKEREKEKEKLAIS